MWEVGDLMNQWEALQATSQTNHSHCHRLVTDLQLAPPRACGLFDLP